MHVGKGERTWICTSCAVRKDAGDDVDVTDGILVFASVRQTKDGITIDGGTGVGRVTKAGLEQPVGAAAINRVPRQMIAQALNDVAKEAGYEGGFHVIISVPDGEKIAAKTFNPRLGIEGGISILGTSGIVEPMSEKALVDTIRTQIGQMAAEGMKDLLLTPGNYGRDYARNVWHLDLERAVKCSNFIGETLDILCEYQFQRVLLVGHIGKLVKIGAGVMNTHSRQADARMETLCACAVDADAPGEILQKILHCITTDEALLLLRETGLLEETMKCLKKRISYHLNRRAYDGLTVEWITFSNEWGTLACSDGAEELAKMFQNEERI
jgi:cobalt-precorrin-5B (C1)-methyltransferase